MTNYPVRIHSETGVHGEALSLFAPDPLIEATEPLLGRNSSVLDVGAGYGTNGIYLAMQGHVVHALEINPEYIENGRRIMRGIGGIAISNRFVNEDMRNIREVVGKIGKVDAVVATRSLQELRKDEAYRMVNDVQDVTKPGGLNIVRAYIATPEQQRVVPHLALFEPDELQDIYTAAGWEMAMDYTYTLRPLGTIAGRPACQSTAELVAVKPQTDDASRQRLISQAEYYRRSDPELFDYYMQQAGV